MRLEWHFMQVDMYKEKLRERDRRKTVVKELGLIEAFFKVRACSQWVLGWFSGLL